MNKYRRADNFITQHLPPLTRGEETPDTLADKYPDEVGAFRSELEAALWLANSKKTLEPRQGFVTNSRQYVVHSIERLPHHGFWRRWLLRYSPQRWFFNLTAPIVLIALFILIFNNLILASRLSIPGDPFYSTKLIIENIQLAFTFNSEHRTDLQMQFLHERTTEFVEMVLDGDYEYLPVAASRMESGLIASLNSLAILQADQPANEVSELGQFREMLSNEVFILEMLKNTSPPSAHEEIDLAIRVAEVGVLALR